MRRVNIVPGTYVGAAKVCAVGIGCAVIGLEMPRDSINAKTVAAKYFNNACLLGRLIMGLISGLISDLILARSQALHPTRNSDDGQYIRVNRLVEQNLCEGYDAAHHAWT